MIARLRRVEGIKVLFVDDCGADETRSILLHESDEKIGAALLEQNVGQHRAIFAGLREVDTPQAVILDGDLQDRPEALPQLIDELGKADVVFAQRVGSASPGSMLLKSLFRLASFGRLPARVGTNMAVGPRALKYLQAVTDPDPYLIGLLALSGLSLHSVPVERESRDKALSSYTLWKRIHFGVRALRGSGLLPWLPLLIEAKTPRVAFRTGWLG